MTIIDNKLKEEINKEYGKGKSIRKVRDFLNSKHGLNLNYHNIRNNLNTSNIGIEEDKDIGQFYQFMKDRNISIKDLHSHFYNKEIEEQIDFQIRDGKKEFEIGVVSDTHLGAKACALKELHHFYRTCKERGITDIVHAGDLCDGGGGVYPGQLSELKVFGFDDMLEYVKANYPKQDGITTHFILGNHDEDFLKHGGANIGKALMRERDDMNYLGFYDATIVINGVKIGLHHGAGGGSYAHSYKLQKYIENLTGDMKPQIYILGHYHGSIFASIRNVHAMLPACFQKPNNFSVRLGLPNIIGGYILKIKLTDKNEVREITPTFIPYYS